MKLSALMFSTLIMTVFSGVACAQSIEEDYGFAVKCYTQLTGGNAYLYKVWLSDKRVKPSDIQQDIIGKKIDYVMETKDGPRVKVKKIIRVIECRYNTESFVNVNAIKLEENTEY